MVAGDPVGHEGNAGLVQRAFDWSKAPVAAECNSLVDFRVRKTLVPPLIPADARDGSHILAELLLQIQAKPVLDSPLFAMGGDIGLPLRAAEKSVGRLAIASHVGVVHIAEKPDGGCALLPQLRAEFQLRIFRSRLADVAVQGGTICCLWHERLSKTQAPAAVVILR